MELQANTWFLTLLTLARELSTEMNKDEKEKIKTFRDATRKKIQVFNIRINKGRSAEIEPALYDELHEFELILRGICKSSGLQQKLKEKPGEAL